ncbi:hypothetical protein, partial [Escherichia coli]|uniref:hypothetical protein n=1 Tax=Escherichia coli TaxID=562 RepID=UPI00196342E9
MAASMDTAAMPMQSNMLIWLRSIGGRALRSVGVHVRHMAESPSINRAATDAPAISIIGATLLIA